MCRKAHTPWRELNVDSCYLTQNFGGEAFSGSSFCPGPRCSCVAVQCCSVWLHRASSEPQTFSDGMVTFSAVSKITQNYTGRTENDITYNERHKSTPRPVDFQEERKEAQQARVTKAHHLLGKENRPQPTEGSCLGNAEVHEGTPPRQLDYSAIGSKADQKHLCSFCLPG